MVAPGEDKYNRPDDIIRTIAELRKRVEALERTSSTAPWYSGLIVADAGTRDTTVITPIAGMTAYLQDEGIFTSYDGSDWVDMSSTGVWITYTPAWTSSGTTPVLNNGTIAGRFTQMGKTVHFGAHIITGTTTTYGTGVFRISLPVTAYTTSPIEQTALCKAFNGSTAYMGLANTGAGTYCAPQFVNGGGLAASNATNPFTWTGGGQHLRAYGTYEAA